MKRCKDLKEKLGLTLPSLKDAGFELHFGIMPPVNPCTFAITKLSSRHFHYLTTSVFRITNISSLVFNSFTLFYTIKRLWWHPSIVWHQQLETFEEVTWPAKILAGVIIGMIITVPPHFTKNFVSNQNKVFDAGLFIMQALDLYIILQNTFQNIQMWSDVS